MICFIMGAESGFDRTPVRHERYLMRCRCPSCGSFFDQAKNSTGPQYCLKCRTLFQTPEERRVPPWILGVVTVLLGNLQIWGFPG